MSSSLEDLLTRRLQVLSRERVCERIWQRDTSVWGGTGGALGWLSLCDTMRSRLDEIGSVVGDARDAFDRVVLLGMGGSSLAPVVLHQVLAGKPGAPAFHMLDSSHPDAVRAVESAGQIDRTLFVVASKSGTTIETRSLLRYFWRASGERGDQFVAITDPGTPLADLAQAKRFRAILLNPADIGGRFSALSLFGLMPAALVGVDVDGVLDGTLGMVEACGPQSDLALNPGAHLGAWIAEAARAGRDKLLLGVADDMSALSLWIEQLVAESTGKDGQGVLPVVGSGASMASFDDVCSVVYAGQDSHRAQGSGYTLPTVSSAHIGAEFFRWEFATAVVGSILGVNPFDQPNVAESKANTKAMLERAKSQHERQPTRRRAVEKFTHGVRRGDYVAVSAWLPQSPSMDVRLADLQEILVERLGVVATVGYGPRCLHSTGQLHKGGPSCGHFLQILDAGGRDLSIPGKAYSFGDLIAAQAEGDRAALSARGRPVIQIDDLAHFLEIM